MTLDDIRSDFALLDDWEDRYRYVIELGRTLDPIADTDRSERTKVRGCTSQVWLVAHWAKDAGGDPTLVLKGDSDAHIVRGLVAILLQLYGGLTPEQVLAVDADAAMAELGLRDHLSPQRSNGLKSMIERIRAEAVTRAAAG